LKDDFDSNAKPAISAEQRRIVNEELLKGLRMDNYEARIELCLQKGADINTATSWEKRTPLMIAVIVEDVARVEYILKKDPDLFKKDKDGQNVFDLANSKIENLATRRKIMDRLLRALPDGAAVPVSGKTPVVTPDAAEDDDGISVTKPIRFRGKPQKPNGNAGGGFSL
jgi:ankyrin repeat protein